MNDTNRPLQILNAIRKQAKAEKQNVAELLIIYGIERFLYRLSKSEHVDSFVLKGGVMLRVWTDIEARQTKDIDMLGFTSNDLPDLEGKIKDILSTEVEDDGLTLDADSFKATTIKEDAEYSGVRFRFIWRLGKTRINMQVDIGVGDIVHPAPVETEIPSLLPDMPNINLRCYSQETAIAEKYQAMVYQGMNNSRIKDFFDIWLLVTQFEFSGEDISAAIQKTFEKRGTKINLTPTFLTEDFVTEKQDMWESFRKKQLKDDTAPEALEDLIKVISTFLTPIAEAVAEGGVLKAAWKDGAWTSVSDS